ncbi:hypothetical protein F5Y05DRAFT_423378 [Hypoxylon sp. FL0543]|nr:hypothetical protein F5Y05DRAFT_423378 [Hypoxylon sp. FL0543]
MYHPKKPLFDPYRVLEISREADARDIKTSYRRLCLQFHPDKAGPQSHETFVQIQAAYELLSDDTRRLRYDERGKKPRRRKKRSNQSTKKADQDGEGKDSDGYEDDEYDGPRKPRHERRWYEKGSNKKVPPTKADMKFRGRTWATSSIDKISMDLDGLDASFEMLCKRVQKAVPKSDKTTWSPLQHISEDIAKKKSEIATVMEEAKGVADGQWKDKPEIQSILAAVCRLQAKVAAMKEKLPVLAQTAESLESALEGEERKRLKRLLRIQASQWQR